VANFTEFDCGDGLSKTCIVNYDDNDHDDV